MTRFQAIVLLAVLIVATLSGFGVAQNGYEKLGASIFLIGLVTFTYWPVSKKVRA